MRVGVVINDQGRVQRTLNDSCENCRWLKSEGSAWLGIVHLWKLTGRGYPTKVWTGGGSTPRFKPYTENRNHIRRTETAPFLYLKTNSKTIDYRWLSVVRRLQAFLYFYVVVSAKVLQLFLVLKCNCYVSAFPNPFLYRKCKKAPRSGGASPHKPLREYPWGSWSGARVLTHSDQPISLFWIRWP